MSNIMAAIDGSKTYILIALGAAVVIVEGALGLDIPLVKYEPVAGNWLNDLYGLAFGGALRSALTK